jgi:L-alanine-DL-glutamate epimerase-like enolase superfamily enzyme
MKSSRRQFLAALPACAALAQTRPLKITAIELVEVRGHREAVRGIDQQYQANPLFIYDELRPAPYRDGTATKSSVAISAIYLRIRAEGAEGLYGPIDKEAAIVVDEQLRAFLMGKDALAQEKLWDQLYRSNRHARRGAYLMAISAVDNTLWDLRGRYFKTPVYRLFWADRHAIRWRPTVAASAIRWSPTKRKSAPWNCEIWGSAIRSGSWPTVRATGRRVCARTSKSCAPCARRRAKTSN